MQHDPSMLTLGDNFAMDLEPYVRSSFWVTNMKSPPAGTRAIQLLCHRSLPSPIRLAVSDELGECPTPMQP